MPTCERGQINKRSALVTESEACVVELMRLRCVTLVRESGVVLFLSFMYINLIKNVPCFNFSI